jgi:hypothetical protein
VITILKMPTGIAGATFRVWAVLGLLYAPPHDARSQTVKARPDSAAAHKESKSYQYENSKYGFTFLLPATWKGCQVVEETWGGYTRTERGDEAVESGPAIRVVNPRSKKSDQYQDISIMIFTHSQWRALQQEKFFVSPAPIGPGELDRNVKYVFALPPRMINPDLEGAEEIEDIMKANPLHAF